MPPEDARQNLLRRAASLIHVPEPVDVGAVDKVDPQLDGPLDGPLGLAGVLLAAQAQAVGQTRHLQARTAKLDVFHALLLGLSPKPCFLAQSPTLIWNEGSSLRPSRAEISQEMEPPANPVSAKEHRTVSLAEMR